MFRSAFLAPVLLALGAMTWSPGAVGAEPAAPDVDVPASIEARLGRRRSLGYDSFLHGSAEGERWSPVVQVRLNWLQKRAARAVHGALDVSLDWGHRAEPAWSSEAREYVGRDVHRLGLMSGFSLLLGGPAQNLSLRAGLGFGYGHPEAQASGFVMRADLGYGFTLSRGPLLFRGEVSLEGNVDPDDDSFGDLSFTLGAGRRF